MRGSRPFSISPALLAALVVCAALAVRLWGDTWPRGFDAYYYATQADWLLKTGTLRIPDSSPVHVGIAALARLLAATGESQSLAVERAVRLWVPLSLLLFYITLLFAVRQSRIGAGRGTSVFCWALLSPALLFTAVELPRNFLMLPALNLAFGAVARRAANRRAAPLRAGSASDRNRGLCRAPFWPVLALLALCAAWLHKSALPYAAILWIWALALEWETAKSAARQLTGKPTPERMQGKAPGEVPGRAQPFRFVVALCLAAALGGALLFALGILHPADMSRLTGRNLTPGALSLALRPHLPVAIKTELAFAALVALIALVTGAVSITRAKAGTAAKFGLLPLILFAATGLLPALGDDPLSLGERFGLLFPYAIMLGCLAVPPATARAPRAARRKTAGMQGRLLSVAAPLSAAALSALFLLPLAHPLRLDPPYAEYDRLIARLQERDIPMLVTHRGIHFYYKFRTGRDAFSYEPEPHWNATRVWRLAFGVAPEEWFALLPPRCAWGMRPDVSADGPENRQDVAPLITLLGGGYALVREDCYREARSAVDPALNPELARSLRNSPMNPASPRPAYLYPKHEGDGVNDTGKRDAANDSPDEFPALPQS